MQWVRNAAKHARAAAARVTLCRDGQFLALTVEDDGEGFDQAKTSMGTGLQGMADRMAALGGTLDHLSPGARNRRLRPADTGDMVRVSIADHPLTATAALVWNGDLPRPLQQILFDTADSATPPAPASLSRAG